MSRPLDPQKRRAQFIPKLTLGLTCLPLICLGIWESQVIQSKPIVVFQEVASIMDSDQNKYLMQTDETINSFFRNKISKEELKTNLMSIQVFWETQLSKISAKKFDPKSKIHPVVIRIKDICQFQIDYLNLAVENSDDLDKMKKSLVEKEMEWKELIK
jgi:hypothetical protein